MPMRTAVKAYRIEAAERAAFLEGMMAPIQPARLEVIALSRIR